MFTTIELAGALDCLHNDEALRRQVGEHGRSYLTEVHGSGKVGAAFHSRYMAPAADQFAEVLADVHLRSPKLRVYSNVTANPYPANASSSEIAGLLSRQIKSPVSWANCVQNMAKEGARDFVEVGPGKILAGMIAQIPMNAEVLS